MQYCRANGIGWSYFAYENARKPLINNSTISTNLVEMLQSGFDTPLNQLSIAQAGNRLVLTWSASSQEPTYVLQWSPTINPAGWSNFIAPTNVLNFQNTVYINATNQAGFFRLLQQ